MIDPLYTTTYAQYNEDIILDALLYDVEKGFYVDVGANYPIVDSVTKRFYDKGWKGINIEPISSLHKKLEAVRKRDINIRAGVGREKGSLTFREYSEVAGHSTFQIPKIETHNGPYTDRKVPITTLNDIFTENNVDQIHFIKIDVEGFEREVVLGNDWKKFRPEVVCIEANHIENDWHADLIGNGYKSFISDGINEYLVAHESWERTEGFDERVVMLDYHALKQHQAQSWKQDSELLQKLQVMIKSQATRISELESENTLSLKNRPLRTRVRIAAKGLGADWIEFKRGSK